MRLNIHKPVNITQLDTIEEKRLVSKPKNKKETEQTFPQSVASGDPTTTGVILWTRISKSVYQTETPLFLEVAKDERFTEERRCYRIAAEEIVPKHDYTIKIDLDGELEVDQRYYYHFEYDNVTSKTGRCRTLPAIDSSPESVRFAIFTCQDYLNGYFGAHHHMAQEPVDFLLDLGDSIYEIGNDWETQEEYSGHRIDLPSGKDVVQNLKDYRKIYQIYRSDQFLQESLERHTRIHVWDDHEFVNDVYWENDPEYGMIVPRSATHPQGEKTEFMLMLVAGAIQAWSEYTPARFEYDPDTEPLNERVKLYQRFQFGDLLALIRTDERLYKSQMHSHWIENRLQYWIEHSFPDGLESRLYDWLSIPSADEDRRSMLGEEQCEWFLEELSKSGSTWTVWANEVLTLPLPVYNRDAWDGYRQERREIMTSIMEARRNGTVRNFVTLTGDMHSYLAGYQRERYPVRDLFKGPKLENRVGIELMTPAVTSVNISEKIAKELISGRGFIRDATRSALADVLGRVLTAAVKALIPYIEFFDSHKWGYSVVEFTPTYCIHRTYTVDKRKNVPDANRKLFKEFRVPEGKIELEEVL